MIPTPDTTVIVNEHAGGGAMADIFRRIEHRLDGVLDEWEVRFTDGPDHATALTRQALRDGAKTILVAGGDGTVNEVINGFFEPIEEAPPRDDAGCPILSPVQPGARLGLLAGGTGGDFRKTLRIPDMDSALKAIGAGETTRIDLGLLAYTDNASDKTHFRLFQNITSAGLGGLVDRFVKKMPRLPGKLAYAAASLRALLQFQNPMVAITIDDDTELELPVSIVAVGNGRYFGGGMLVCPGASPTDGLFDVVIMGDLTKWELATLSSTIYDGAHIYDPKVISHRGKRVTLRPMGGRAAGDVFLDVDGEPLGRLPASMNVVPATLDVIASL